MMVVPVLPLLLVEGSRPVAEGDGMAGPFMERLPEKLGASAAKMNRLGFAAVFTDRRDAAELLHIGG